MSDECRGRGLGVVTDGVAPLELRFYLMLLWLLIRVEGRESCCGDLKCSIFPTGLLCVESACSLGVTFMLPFVPLGHITRCIAMHILL